MKEFAKKEREEIFRLFLTSNKLRFNEIEKALDIRSNMVAYHLSEMLKNNLLEKEGDYYVLTKEAEKYIPIFGAKLCPVPCILIAAMHEDKILLINRNKRPYQNHWAMPGGKMLLEENFSQAAARLLYKEAGLKGEFKGVNAVIHETVEDEIIKHSFILFMVKVSVKDPEFRQKEAGALDWFEKDKLPKKIVESDLWLIRNELDSRLDIKESHIRETDAGYDFRII